jgi:hypothetical protein
MRSSFVGVLMGVICVGAQDLLQPTATQPGTKEEHGIITTMALTYVKVRNSVRDAYMSIQYTRAMVQTLDDQKEWVRRNLRSWDLVGKRVVKLVSEPGRWDGKLRELESIFDRTDYLLWEETRIFDDLMYRQERYAQRISGYLGSHFQMGQPLVSEFYKANASLYRADPSWVPQMEGDTPEEGRIRREREKDRLQAAYAALQRTPEGRVRDATILAASRAQAQIAALRRIQRAKAEKYQSMQLGLLDTRNLNSLELGRTLSDLRGAENSLDALILGKLEMEIIWAHLGAIIFDMSASRSNELSAASAFEELSEK